MEVIVMVGDSRSDPIVRTRVDLGAPTGEGTVYIAQSGREWRSAPGGGVVSSGQHGVLSGGGKFGPVTVISTG